MSTPEFYDEYVSYQVNSGINDRIYGLYKRLCKIGMTPADHILEIGCGIGALTFLLAQKIKTGSIEAIDISPKSIEYAKAHIKQPRVTFTTGDILRYQPKQTSFDKILLFDVLEHIPESDHLELLSRIKTWMRDDSLLLINLPNPQYILYDQANNPAALQELDQPIFPDKLISLMGQLSLDVYYLETYSVWAKHDYHFFIVNKRGPFKEQLLSEERNFFEKLRTRLKRELRKVLHRYPRK